MLLMRIRRLIMLQAYARIISKIIVFFVSLSVPPICFISYSITYCLLLEAQMPYFPNRIREFQDILFMTCTIKCIYVNQIKLHTVFLCRFKGTSLSDLIQLEKDPSGGVHMDRRSTHRSFQLLWSRYLIEPLLRQAVSNVTILAHLISTFIFTQDDKWTNFPVPTFTAMDPSYTLPDNVAIITLQVTSPKLITDVLFLMWIRILLDLLFLHSVGASGT